METEEDVETSGLLKVVRSRRTTIY